MVTLSAKTNTFHQGVIPMNIVFCVIAFNSDGKCKYCDSKLSNEIATCASSGSLNVKMKAILRSAEQARQRPGL